jgi:predicted ester cyclase
MGHTPADLAHSLFRVLQTGDAALAAEIVAPGFSNREAEVAPPACSVPGPAGVLASSAWMRSAFSDLRFPILGIAQGENEVWVRLRMQGRQTGPFVRFKDGRLDQAIPPTGQEIDFEQIHVLSLENGQVARHKAVRDDIAMLGQLGIFPPNPAVAMRLVGFKLTGKAGRAAQQVAAAAAAAAADAKSTTA